MPAANRLRRTNQPGRCYRRYAAPIGEFFFFLVLSLESSRAAAVWREAACLATDCGGTPARGVPSGEKDCDGLIF